MAVVIQDFEAVQEAPGGAGETGGKPRAPTGPVAHAALDKLIGQSRARHLRLAAG
jgi:hypothetical protein